MLWDDNLVFQRVSKGYGLYPAKVAYQYLSTRGQKYKTRWASKAKATEASSIIPNIELSKMDYKSFKNTEDLVKSVLATNVESRGDDVELVLSVWEKQGLILTPEQKHIAKRCYSSESITRARRKIQDLGLHRPSQEIQQRRMFMEDAYRENYRKS